MSELILRALIAATILGTCAPLIGTFVVQRNMSLIGDGLGHVAAAGVGLALWLDFAPQPFAIGATVFAAIAIEWILHASKSSDTALAIIFYSGIAASITFAGKSSSQSQLQQYLFGSLLSVTVNDIYLLIAICFIASLGMILLSKLFISISIDESSAKIADINVHFLHVSLMTFVALIVSISMSITGLLLISAVMVVPVMSARFLGQNFIQTWALSCVFGALGSISGLAISVGINSAPGGTIVLTHVAIFLLVGIFKFLKNKKQTKNLAHQH